MPRVRQHYQFFPLQLETDLCLASETFRWELLSELTPFIRQKAGECCSLSLLVILFSLKALPSDLSVIRLLGGLSVVSNMVVFKFCVDFPFVRGLQRLHS